MTRIPTARPPVEQLVRELLGTAGLAVDEDGDVAVRWGRVLLFIRLLDRDPPRLRVECPMLHGVRPTARVLDAISRLDAELRSGRMYWDDGQVVVATEVSAQPADRNELKRACQAVADIAAAFDGRLREAVARK